MHLDHNDGGQPHQVGGGNNIDDQLGNVQDGLTLDSLLRRRFTDAEYEARVSSLNGSQRVPYKKIVVEYTRAVLEYWMGNRESMPNPLCVFITGGAGTCKSHVISASRSTWNVLTLVMGMLAFSWHQPVLLPSILED